MSPKAAESWSRLRRARVELAVETNPAYHPLDMVEALRCVSVVDDDGWVAVYGEFSAVLSRLEGTRPEEDQ